MQTMQTQIRLLLQSDLGLHFCQYAKNFKNQLYKKQNYAENKDGIKFRNFRTFTVAVDLSASAVWMTNS